MHILSWGCKMQPWHSGDGGQEGELEIAQERKGKAFYRDVILSASPLWGREFKTLL